MYEGEITRISRVPPTFFSDITKTCFEDFKEYLDPDTIIVNKNSLYLGKNDISIHSLDSGDLPKKAGKFFIASEPQHLENLSSYNNISFIITNILNLKVNKTKLDTKLQGYTKYIENIPDRYLERCVHISTEIPVGYNKK